ncbi:MAG: multicopper oxidase domain-containing protein [Anaerolineae bacterium]|nr:multicopper oxidase domain-containing protein [Anaerolineae bacterium]
MSENPLSRRGFLGMLGVSSLGALLAACRPATSSQNTGQFTAQKVESASTTTNDSGGMDHQNQSGGADDMDAMHERGLKMFPAKTEGLGGQPLAFKLDGDVKVFEITCKEVNWEVEPGKRVKSMTYNGTVPGPEIRVTEGDKVRLIVKNDLPQSTGVHCHGIHTPNNMDGVPYLTQPPIKPGQTFIYEFVAKPSGTHMYHSHHNAAEQVAAGLLGPFIVEPKDKTKSKWQWDKEYTIILNDGPHGFTLNGKSFPATSPLTAKKGQKILVRFVHEGSQMHPMHLHGMPMRVIAHDGYPLQYDFQLDTLDISPGQRKDVLIECEEPGAWAFHCHVLGHAESPKGMFGMVTALIIEA